MAFTVSLAHKLILLSLEKVPSRFFGSSASMKFDPLYGTLTLNRTRSYIFHAKHLGKYRNIIKRMVS